MNKGKKEKG